MLASHSSHCFYLLVVGWLISPKSKNKTLQCAMLIQWENLHHLKDKRLIARSIHILSLSCLWFPLCAKNISFIIFKTSWLLVKKRIFSWYTLYAFHLKSLSEHFFFDMNNNNRNKNNSLWNEKFKVKTKDRIKVNFVESTLGWKAIRFDVFVKCLVLFDKWKFVILYSPVEMKNRKTSKTYRTITCSYIRLNNLLNIPRYL